MQQLEKIRILDFTRTLGGPCCTVMLGDPSGHVIKVERSGVGDGI